jgi:chaperonin GroES
MKLRPTEDKVVLKVIEQTNTTASGFVLPDSAKEKSQQAEVVAVGPGKLTDDGKRLEMEFAVGDIVVFTQYGGAEITLNGEKFLLVRSAEILAIVEK